MRLGVCVVVPEVWLVVLSGAEQGVSSSSMITWQSCTAVRGMERGFGGRAGASWMVWEGSWTVVGARWADRIVSSCKRHVSTSMAAHRRVVPFAGLQTVSARFLRPC